MIKLEKNISVLGSTGSIGTQTLEVAKELKIKVHALTANENIDLLEEQIRTFRPEIAAVANEEKAKILKEKVKDTSTKILAGEEGICQAATAKNSGTVVAALCGISGLVPTSEAIKSGKNIALANKEVLVTGGKIIKKMAEEKNISLHPVDSEHSAIFQCLQGVRSKNDLKKLILTASGGPFFGKSKDELEKVTLKQALNHPSWSMGKKISVDSATMMNKGFEIIEAAHLFDVSTDNIDVIIHRQSVVHSMIELKDGSVIAQMAVPSMKLPIQYALTFPHHEPCAVESLNLSKFKELTFFKPDYETFESINLCKKAFEEDLCVVLNAANEKAVELFLKEKIKFLDIIKLIKEALEEFKNAEKPTTINEIIALDKKVKAQTATNAEKLRK